MSRSGERRARMDPTLYLVTDTALCAPHGGVAAVAAAAVAGGVTAVQVRDKSASRRELLSLTRAVQAALADRPDVAVVVNDALDVALLAGADGVHLGQQDLHPGEARSLAGPDFSIGLSVSSAAELDRALALDTGSVDLLGIGPVWATPTKADADPPVGLAGLTELAGRARAAGLVTVAIGGVAAANAAAVLGARVAGVCVVSEICAAADPLVAARTLRAAGVAAA